MKVSTESRKLIQAMILFFHFKNRFLIHSIYPPHRSISNERLHTTIVIFNAYIAYFTMQIV